MTFCCRLDSVLQPGHGRVLIPADARGPTAALRLGVGGSRRDGELNVDLSSADCGSEEPHWQAEHRIYRSVCSKQGSRFSEVDELEGTRRPGFRRAGCISTLCVLPACVSLCVCGGVCVGTRTVSPGKDLDSEMSPQSHKHKSREEKWRKRDEQQRVLKLSCLPASKSPELWQPCAPLLRCFDKIGNDCGGSASLRLCCVFLRMFSRPHGRSYIYSNSVSNLFPKH